MFVRPPHVEIVSTGVWTAFGPTPEYDLTPVTSVSGRTYSSLEVKRVPEIMHKSWTRSALPGDLVDVKRGRKPGACDQNVVLVDLFRINEQSSKPTWEAVVFVPGIGCKLVPATNIIKSEGKRALTSEFNDAMTSYSKFGINFNILAPKRKVREDASTAGETKKRTKTSSKARGAGAWAGSARRKSRGLLFSKDGKEEEEGKEKEGRRKFFKMFCVAKNATH